MTILTRRSFLGGLAIALAAPAIVRASSLMVHVPLLSRPIPDWFLPFRPPELNAASLERALIEIHRLTEDQADMMMAVPSRYLGMALVDGEGQLVAYDPVGVAFRSIAHPRDRRLPRRMFA